MLRERRDAGTDRDLSSVSVNAITLRLESQDDPAFWRFALEAILASTVAESQSFTGKDCILTEIGRCSHWIRPHWKTRAGTAWPYGYGNDGNGFAFTSLPEFDWSIKWKYDAAADEWNHISGQPTRRPLVHRIALPARTSRHPQATVHTIWAPGSPNDPKYKLTIVYGFQKSHGHWSQFTSWDRKHK